MTTTFVAPATPVFSTTIVYRIGSPGRTAVPEAGELDFVTVSFGEPTNVATGGEFAVCPLAMSSAWSVIGLGAAAGTVTVNVRSGETSTLFAVAAGNVTAPFAPVPAAVESL